jgi:polyisoprenoid-binding protein YceI
MHTTGDIFMKKQFMILLALFAISFSGLAQTTVWKIDPSHSRVGFSVTHMVVAEVLGNFKEFSGTITQNGKDYSQSTVDVLIKSTSISTDNERRDNHLRSADFFDVQKFPEITFKSTSFEKTGENTYSVKGNLTMHGITKEVVLDAKYIGQVSNGHGGFVTAFKAATKINRYDFDLKWNRTLEAGGFLVSENVDITIMLELNQQ